MESYQFIKQIGQGSYGEVWLVKCSRTQKKYVLKQFDLHFASKREQRSAFLEARLLSTLKHPNIVSYLDSFYNCNGSLFIVMGYCECGDLSSYIKNRKGVYFEEKEIVNWFVQICLALKYLHDKNILHRDLKTENIFLTKTKLIKVGDLGIARVLKAAEEMATTLIGTPYYMSPEIFAGKPYNQKSDIWSLGCCMYEIVTLERAFEARGIHDIMQRVTFGKVSTIPEIYSVELFDIITSMLKQDPLERPSVNEILLDDFIRKYILLFLQESPVKCNSKNSSCRSTPITATNANTVNTQSAFHDMVIGMSIKTENNSSLPKVKTIPDSNGNSDGNDNSQQQALNKQAIPSAILPQLIDKDHKRERSSDSSKSRDSQNTASTKFSGHHSSRLLSHGITLKGNLSPSSTKSAESSAENRDLIAQKQKSEQAFNLLNQITCTIKSSRFQELDAEPSRTGSKVKFYTGTTPPKSADEVYAHTKLPVPDQSRRHAISASQSGSRATSRGECHLPHIGKVGNEKSTLMRNDNQVNLPCIQSSEAEVSEKDFAKAFESQFISKAHRLVDKMLLENIMRLKQQKHDLQHLSVCNDENQFAHKLSHSAPTSTDVLCLKTAQK